MDFARFVLLTFGLVYMATEAAIVAPLRLGLARFVAEHITPQVVPWLYCRMCTSFWFGIVVGLLRAPYPGATFAETGLIAVATMWMADGFVLHQHVTFRYEQPDLWKGLSQQIEELDEELGVDHVTTPESTDDDAAA
jgi:hypothetical protein